MGMMVYKTLIAWYPRKLAVFSVISGIVRMNNIIRRLDVNFRRQVTDLFTSKRDSETCNMGREYMTTS